MVGYSKWITAIFIALGKKMNLRMTLERLACLSGLNAHLLDQLEIGRNELNLNHIVCLAAALRVEARTLMGVG